MAGVTLSFRYGIMSGEEEREGGREGGREGEAHLMCTGW